MFCYFLLLSEPFDIDPVLDTVPAVPIFLGMATSRRAICMWTILLWSALIFISIVYLLIL